MEKEADIRTVSWKFIPPGASNMGGAWERSVRSVKTALAAMLTGRGELLRPRQEILHALLLEVEHIVNSRPLKEVSTEPTEAEGLTPNYFLPQRATSTTTCYLDLQTGPANVSTPRQSLLAEVVEGVLTKYSFSYLVTRQARSDPTCHAPTEGDVVLIVDPSSPRYSAR